MKRPHIDHFAVAEACLALPEQWQPVGEYNSTQSARGVIGYIEQAGKSRSMQASAYTPAGAFEARFELTEFGARVEARYVGVSDDDAWADALAAIVGVAA